MSDSGPSATDVYVIISALDTSTERDIQKALQNLVRGRSSLSIAHRLSVSLFLCLDGV
jgi:ABC-type transport system involved in Fe-S cluster assembly fused permease/ATPase subunit